MLILTPKLLETHVCVLSTAATDALVLKHTAIKNVHCIVPVSYQTIAFILNNTSIGKYSWLKFGVWKGR